MPQWYACQQCAHQIKSPKFCPDCSPFLQLLFVRSNEMSKLIGLACVFMLLFPTMKPQSKKFSKYKAIETYEVRPGFLIMPRYSDDGLVCEIGLEKLHYSPEMIRLDSSLSREEIDQIFDELVPADERGPKTKDFGANLIDLVGQ